MKFRNVLLSLLVLGAAGPLSWATPLPPDPHFVINLNTPLGCVASPSSPCPTNSGGWNALQNFNAQANSGLSTQGFTSHELGPTQLNDPDMTLDLGGFSTAINSTTFQFQANAAGGGVLDFFNNSGVFWSDVLVTTHYNPLLSYVCGTTAFNFCGFRIDPLDPNELDILYSGGNGIISAVPEPASWGLLMTGLALFALYQNRRKTARQ